jgi:flavin-dependent dehydrogenase
MSDAEIVIVGGGPAGAACACGLAMAGREVILLERTREPHHKVCGEFVSGETRAALDRLGIDVQALGAAEVGEAVLHFRARTVAAALPVRASSLSRYRLDAALLRRAEECGAHVRRGLALRSLVRSGAMWTLRCADGTAIRCRQLVLATGKWGVRGLAETRDASLVGLKIHLRLASAQERAISGRVELFFVPEGYAGLELVEEGIANLCLVLRRATVKALASGWAALREHLIEASPRLGERLCGASPRWEPPLAVVCPAAGHLESEAQGLYRVGDRLAHIPPLAGDGLAIALGSAALAAEHIRRGASAAAYLAEARRLTRRPIGIAGALSRLLACGAGPGLLMGVASMAPGMIAAFAKATRLPFPARASQ